MHFANLKAHIANHNGGKTRRDCGDVISTCAYCKLILEELKSVNNIRGTSFGKTEVGLLSRNYVGITSTSHCKPQRGRTKKDLGDVISTCASSNGNYIMLLPQILHKGR